MTASVLSYEYLRRGLLRLESFSGSCGVYARLDILPPGLDGDDIGHGTTNVDVNPPLRRALAVLGGLDPLHLTVGPDQLEVRTFDGRFVEKRVPLPKRWRRPVFTRPTWWWCPR